MRTLLSPILALALLGVVATPALSAPCKDAKGKFIKCPTAAPVRCKDAHGKFTKCGTRGAKPMR